MNVGRDRVLFAEEGIWPSNCGAKRCRKRTCYALELRPVMQRRRCLRSKHPASSRLI